MTAVKQGVTYRFYVLVAVAFVSVAGLYFFNRAREPELVKQAILDVAPAGSKVTAFEISTSGRRSSLWCGSIIGMEGGAVSVLLHEWPIVAVSEVAPAWTQDPNWKQRWILSECRRVASGPSALP